MIINNFNLVRIALLPTEADTPLVIDPNAPLAAAAAFERLQSGAGKCGQIPQPLGIVQHSQLPQRYSLHGVIQSPREAAMPDTLGLFAGKARNHRPKLKCSLPGVNRVWFGPPRTVCFDPTIAGGCHAALLRTVSAPFPPSRLRYSTPFLILVTFHPIALSIPKR
jgi:hypothetical protein